MNVVFMKLQCIIFGFSALSLRIERTACMVFTLVCTFCVRVFHAEHDLVLGFVGSNVRAFPWGLLPPHACAITGMIDGVFVASSSHIVCSQV